MLRRLVKAVIPKNLFRSIEPYGHLAEAVFFNVLTGFPARGMKVIGVTGTNGKTTTSFLIHRMLVENGIHAGLMTTVATGTDKNLTPMAVHMTTLPVPQLLKRIKDMRKEGIEWLVLETTSHALAQHRVWGIPFSLAVLTNITHEHLDYHGTFERYRDAKKKLFTLTGRNNKGLQTGIVNAEDPSADLFAREVPTAVRYGISTGDVRAIKVEAGPAGSQIELEANLKGKTEHYQINTSLPGQFNVYNALAAACVGEVIGLSTEEIVKGIGSLESVAGRMNTIDEGQDFGVIVDFAHTPDSFEKLLPEVKKITKGRLICVFGSAGRRDKTKRAVQGELAGKFSDVVVVTEEDDRDENGQAILEEIASGAEKAGKQKDKDLYLIHDRTQAIEWAINNAEAGDIVLLLGKGHEATIERADGEHPWNESEVARQAIRSRLKITS